MQATFYAGTAKVDITPEHPIHLIPTSDSPRTNLGTVRRLYARIIVTRQKDQQGTEQDAVIVSIDSLMIPLTCVASLRARIYNKWKIDRSAVMLHVTHTHSAPFPTYGLYAAAYDSSLDKEFDDYIRGLEDAVIAGIGTAIAALEEVTVERGSGQCGFSSYRRKQVEGQWVMAPDEQGPKDPEVTVIRFKRAVGTTLALIVQYACHPTITYDDYISPDYPGTAMEQIEQQLGDDVVSLFLQGCSGDIRPGLIRDGNYYIGTDADVVRLAQMLSDETMAIVERPMQPVTPSGIVCRELSVELPFRSVPTLEELAAYRDDSGDRGKWSRKLLANPEFLMRSGTLEMTYIHLADELSFLAMSGEMVADYGHFIKAASTGNVIPIGYTNGIAGYVPTARQLAEGGYEAADFFYRHGLPSPYDDCIEETIKQGIATLIGRRTL